MKVLIAEDQADDRRLLRASLEHYGCEVIEAADGQEGLELAHKHTPEVIISDALMPRMDGFKFLRETRQSSELKAIPFIFYTATYVGNEEARLALSLGAEAYIVKPKGPEEFWREVKEILESMKTRKEGTPAAELVEEDKEYLKRYSELVAVKLDEKVKDLEKELAGHKKAEEQIRILADLVDIAPALITVHDSDGNYLYVNQTACDLHGYSREELLALNIRKLDIPEDERMMALRIKQIMETGNASFEVRHYRKDRSIMPLQLFTKLTEWGGKKVILSVASDITERKKAEDAIQSALAEKEVLLKEVHHRVKNNMQIISSLLNLQQKKIQGPELKMIFEETRGRIKSMSFIHEMLYNKRDFSKIPCGEYISKLVKDLVSAAKVKADEIRTTVKIDDIMFSVDTAIPLGLITNELVTNALKYAIPHDGGGELFVSLTKADDLFTLSVKDNGAGLPEGFDYKNADTLGLQLVSVLVKQIGGDFRISSERGTEAVVTFKQ